MARVYLSRPRCSRWALLLLLLASPALAGPAVRCQAHHKPTLNRLQTLCSDGTRAVSTWSPTLRQWEDDGDAAGGEVL